MWYKGSSRNTTAEWKIKNESVIFLTSSLKWTIKQIWFPVQKFGMNMILKVSYGHKHSIYKKKKNSNIVNNK